MLASTQASSYINEAETKKMLNQELLIGEVPSVFKCIHDLIVDRVARRSYPYIKNVNERSRQVILVSLFFNVHKFLYLNILSNIPLANLPDRHWQTAQVLHGR